MSVPTLQASSPSLYYEDYMDQCFTLSSGAVATNFIRSEFDYGTRQRRAVRGYDTYNVRIVVQYYQFLNWKRFWDDLNYGNDKFYTSQIVNGDTATNKVVRFTSGYKTKDIGNAMLEVVVPLEVILSGDPSEDDCPLVPSTILIIKDGLEPC